MIKALSDKRPVATFCLLWLFGFFTWFRKLPHLYFYKNQGIIATLKVSDKYGLWMIPFFVLIAFQYMGAELVEEIWGVFGAVLSSLLLIDALSFKKDRIL